MKISIEKLLQWAFTEDLGSRSGNSEPVGTSNFTMIMDVIQLGAIIDRSRNIKGMAFALEPDEDAVMTVEAVRALASRGFDIADGWNPFPEWNDEHGLIAEAVRGEVEALRAKGDRLNGRHAASLVYSCAVMGRGPDWQADQPACGYVQRNGIDAWFLAKKSKDLFGKVHTIETDGYDRKRRKPMRGAYRKMELLEPLRGAIISRLEWQIWQDALCELHAALENQLKSHDLVSFFPRRQPWANFRKLSEIPVSV